MIVDAGPLVAAAATGDRYHAACVDLLANADSPLLVPTLVITEVAYFLADRVSPSAERAFAASFQAGELIAEPVEPVDWQRIAELVESYDGLGLGIVDASVVALCERLGETRLATLDRRHFGVVKPRHCSALTLLPG